MAIITQYKCDRCEKTLPKANELWTVGISFSNYTYSPSIIKRIEVCRPCAIALGVLIPSQKDETPAPDPAPTIEDLVREIVARCT